MASLESRLESVISKLDDLQTDMADEGNDSAAQAVTEALTILQGISINAEEESESEI